MRVAFYIPDKGNGGEDAGPVLEQVCERACSIFGGCTVYPAFGRWVSGHGLVAEPIHIVEAYGVPADDNTLDAIAYDIKQELSQDAVAYSYDNELRLR